MAGNNDKNNANNFIAVSPILFVLIILVFIFSTINKQNNTSPTWKLEPSSDFFRIWQIDEVNISKAASNFGTFLFITDQCLGYHGEYPNKNGYQFYCLDTASGKVVNQFKLTRGGVLAHDEDTIYAAYHKTVCGKRECDAIEVQAYTIDSFTLTWVQRYQGIAFVSQLEIDDEYLVVNGGGSQSSYSARLNINPNNGELLDYGQHTGIKINFNISDSAIIEFAHTKGNLLGNVTTDNDIAYFLTTNSAETDITLWAVEIETEKVLGTANLTNTTLAESEYWDDFYIVANDGLVVFYSEGSRQLIGLQSSLYPSNNTK